MNNMVIKVFSILAILVVIFLLWGVLFNSTGIVRTVYNQVADGVNEQYQKVAGPNAKILPKWTDSSVTPVTTFDIDTRNLT